MSVMEARVQKGTGEPLFGPWEMVLGSYDPFFFFLENITTMLVFWRINNIEGSSVDR